MIGQLKTLESIVKVFTAHFDAAHNTVYGLAAPTDLQEWLARIGPDVKRVATAFLDYGGLPHPHHANACPEDPCIKGFDQCRPILVCDRL